MTSEDPAVSDTAAVAADDTAAVAADDTEEVAADDTEEVAADDTAAIAADDTEAVACQLRRPPRGLRAVAHRCPCGLPDVVETSPRLPDGTPFPTLYYLTCPRASAAVGRLESSGLMREMTGRLAAEPGLRQQYLAAHRDYLARRDAVALAAGLEPLPAAAGSAGGMPDRVKCLHALVAQELAVPGSNPLGREALAAAGQWWRHGPCVELAGRREGR